MDVDVFGESRTTLGESPIWDARAEAVVAIDAAHPAVLVWRTRAPEVLPLPDRPGSVALRASGGFLIAMGREFWSVDAESGRLTPIAALPSGPDEGRLNDGKCDPAGRFWSGTATADRSPKAALYRLDPDGGVTRHLDGVTMSNGLGWSPDGRTFYYIDTLTYRIDAFDFDVAAGTIANRRSFVEIGREAGLPDGLTVDRDGAVWVAIWGAGQVRRYLADGTLERTVSFPAANVTSCTFGGPRLEVLFVTSARSGLDDRQLLDQPTAGALFAVRGLGIVGLPPSMYGR